eukprot:TRINITY_DN4732_c0_g1_i4.p1 TRINITY_DN4732_c0_g1~~TRINITY_DN4732_c0_g1_i4.p1  ORF type:complete len:212 (+),score=17.08 TRINITY_DN4732_c0_g1_i4:64-636(+)
MLHSMLKHHANMLRLKLKNHLNRHPPSVHQYSELAFAHAATSAADTVNTVAAPSTPRSNATPKSSRSSSSSAPGCGTYGAGAMDGTLTRSPNSRLRTVSGPSADHSSCSMARRSATCAAHATMSRHCAMLHGGTARQSSAALPKSSRRASQRAASAPTSSALAGAAVVGDVVGNGRRVKGCSRKGRSCTC